MSKNKRKNIKGPVRQSFSVAPFPATAMAFLGYFLKRHKFQFIPIAILMLFWSANEALFPYFMGEIIDGVAQSQGAPNAVWSVVATPFVWMASCFIIMEIAMRIMGVLMAYAYPAIRSDVRQSVTKYVKDHDLSYFLDTMSGNLSNKIHDLPKTIHALLDQLLETVLSIVFSFLFMIAVLWTASPVFAVVLFLWGIFHMGISFYFFPELSGKSREHAEGVSRLQGQTIDFISNILTVRLLAHKRYEMQRIEKAQKEEVALSIRASWAYQKVNFIRGVGGIVFIISSVYILIIGWQNGWVTTGGFSLVALGIFRMLGQIWHLSLSIQGIFRNYGTIDSALEIARRPHHIVDHPEARRLNATRGAISIENMFFHYKKDTPLFEDFSLSIKSGEKIGLVGFSGSGKTSFVNLILRFYDIQSGFIKIDNQDISRVTQDSLRSHIAMIPQDPSLFHRTLMENIRVGKPDASDAEVMEASKKARCHDFIELLEGGYDSMVGERGLKLSGGQRQRIAIARAILKDAPILIMDEATSALDSATERCIQESLKEVMKNRTTIVIAHRLSTLSTMDRICVFDKGKVMEDGSIQTLLTKEKGAFAHLWHLQQGGFLPE